MGVVDMIIATIIVQFKLNPGWRDIEDYKLLEKSFGKNIDLPDFKINEDEEDNNENKEESKE